MNIDDGAGDRQVQVRFITKLQDIPFKVPNTTIPANYSRLDLSKVVNALLKAGKALITKLGFPPLILSLAAEEHIRKVLAFFYFLAS